MNKETLEDYKKIIDAFSKATIAVIGDLVADHYIIGKQSRLSREAPVIVVKFYKAARLANYAASVVVMKRGTATLTKEELLEIMDKDLGKDD